MKKIILLFSVMLLFSSCELDSFLFNPEKISEYRLPGNTIPDSLISEVTFKSEGYTLYGFWVKAKNPSVIKTILYCHGNKHNIDEYWDRVLLLHETGVNVFIFDYRGFGKSEGESSQASLYTDGKSALLYLFNNRYVYSDSLGIYGYSLGNVPAIYLASKIASPLFLVSEAPFASANSLTQGGTVIDIPEGWLTGGNFNNVEMIKGIKTRFLLIHGSNDDDTRFSDNGRVIYEAAPQPKELILVNGANHTNVPYKMGTENYVELIKRYFNTAP